MTAITSDYGQRIAAALDSANREQRQAETDSVKKEAIEKLKETYAEAEIGNAIEEVLKKTCRAKILRERKHVDGRDIKQDTASQC